MNFPLLHEVKTVILAGGKGTRLYPLTIDIPKPMVEIDGKPLLHHILNNSLKYGFNTFLFKTGHFSGRIEEYFSDGKRFNCHIDYFLEKEPLGTAGGLKFLEKEKHPIIILYGDSPFVHLDISKLKKAGWTPKTSIEEGVRKTTRYLLQNPYLLD